MSKPVYIFSGLGADERTFQFIALPGYDVHFIKWLIPLKAECIEHYAKRIAQQIKMPDPVLIGLSFGGMMAVEVAKIIAVEKIILISSAKTKKEIPLIYRIAGMFYLHKTLPAAFMKQAGFMSNWLFSVQSRVDKELLAAILQNTDPIFLKWAIDKIAKWKNTTLHKNIFHIHGTADRILPLRNVSANAAIAGGGHFMIVNKAEEINDLLRRAISA